MEQIATYLGVAASLAQLITCGVAIWAFAKFRHRQSVERRVVEQYVRSHQTGSLAIYSLEIATALGLDEAEVRAAAKRNKRLETWKARTAEGAPVQLAVRLASKIDPATLANTATAQPKGGHAG